MDQLIEFASNNFILAGIWVALIAMLIFSYISAWTSSVKELSTHEATVLMNKDDAIVQIHALRKSLKLAIFWVPDKLNLKSCVRKTSRNLKTVKTNPLS